MGRLPMRRKVGRALACKDSIAVSLGERLRLRGRLAKETAIVKGRCPKTTFRLRQPRTVTLLLNSIMPAVGPCPQRHSFAVRPMSSGQAYKDH